MLTALTCPVPGCGKQFQISPEMAGQQVMCPFCSNIVQIAPLAPPSPPPAAPPPPDGLHWRDDVRKTEQILARPSAPGPGAANVPEFDPYLSWLGIPAGQRPPTHYQLLGIAVTEKDPHVIEQAFNRRTTHLFHFRTGATAGVCCRILEAVSQARDTLLDPARRKAYDLQLIRSTPEAAFEAPRATQVQPARKQGTAPNAPPAPSASRSGVWTILLMPAAAVLLVMALGGGSIAWYMFVRGVPDESIAAIDDDPDRMPTAPATQPADKPLQTSMEATKPEPKVEPKPEPKVEPKPEPKVNPKPEPKVEPKPPDNRTPVPDAAAQAESEKLIKELFKADYARNKPADMLALATRLLQQGKETKDNPAARFVLYREARDLAAQAGAAALALSLVEELAKEYAVVALEMQIGVLELLGRSANTPAQHEHLAEIALVLLEGALAVDQYEAAPRFIQVAEAAALKSKNERLLTSVQARGQEAHQLRKDFERAHKAQETLATTPEDPDANLAMGKFLCLSRDEWEKGLPLLSKGSERRLREVAKKDLAMPKEAAELTELGDSWWDLAETERGTARTALQRRAYHWYQQALPSLQGLTKTKVEKRLTELEKNPAVKIPSSVVVLSRALLDRDKGARLKAAQALAKLAKEPGASAGLLVALQDDDKEVCQAAIEAMKDIGPLTRSDAPALARALKSKSPEVQVFAAGSLADLGPDARDAVPALVASFQESKAEAVRTAIVSALEAIGPDAQAAAPILVEGLKDKTPGFRLRVAEALAAIGGQEARQAVPVLLEALKDKDDKVRAQAAKALKNLGPLAAAATPALIQALKDPDKQVRQGAIETLGKVGKAAVPSLLEALKEINSTTRLGVVAALAEMGPDASTAIATLTARSDSDPSPEVRKAAKAALTKIQKKP